jgi:deoxyribodipyrimidine photolyase-related protein
MIEAPAKARRRPYHQHKLALVLANHRHFALEQARRGVAVRYLTVDDPQDPAPYARTLSTCTDLGPLVAMEPAERELREEVASLIDAGLLSVVRHEGWLTTESDLDAAEVRTHGVHVGWRMDRFYRAVRQRTGILMDGDRPVGGRYSFDGENREPWRGTPPAPPRRSYPRDPIKDEVCDLVRSAFADHPGRPDVDHLPATAADAIGAWRHATEACMASFGPYLAVEPAPPRAP